MAFTYERTIRLADTDAAGVVFFARYLALCHEAYEAALTAAGCPVQSFLGRDSDTLIPISRASADYLRPLICGDVVRISVQPARLSEDSFAINYEVRRSGTPEKIAARVRTEHVVTSRSQRTRAPLPAALATWVDAG
ncbi:thioesterase [Cephaloticoccus primus]|uniref:Thioesterase n=1 Tax=Cephaloticoccus primus TaxID=1548207 RepID=A0A139SQQ5_9BACT|nr:thioesterase family protein [Cephaloticoccus primus]KXU36867.1 thioesterase [Cephaloticoccus primus]